MKPLLCVRSLFPRAGGVMAFSSRLEKKGELGWGAWKRQGWRQGRTRLLCIYKPKLVRATKGGLLSLGGNVA